MTAESRPKHRFVVEQAFATHHNSPDLPLFELAPQLKKILAFKHFLALFAGRRQKHLL